MTRTTTVAPAAKRTPTTYTDCPGCGATVANLQVVSACTQCDWMGLL